MGNCVADQFGDSKLSEEMLAMLYCMAIMRLVNCVVEKTRKKNELSIAEAADAIGIPRSLIDIRHEGSHRELPALQVVRSASMKALDWLKYYYWEPQKNAIPFQGTGNATIRNEIKSKLHELAFCLRSKLTRHSQVKGKRGYKRDFTKILKGLVGFYSSFSPEVVSVLLELLNTKDSSDSSDATENTQKDPSIHTSLNEWKLVIKKISNKKSELRVALLNAILDMIETQEGMMVRGLNTSSDSGASISQVEHLSSLFTWLVKSFKGLKPPENDSADEARLSSEEKTLSVAVLMAVLRKCLVSASANDQLMKSALHLAKLTGDEFLVQKLNKLLFLVASNLDATEGSTCIASSNSIFFQQEKSLNQAAKKLDWIKRRKAKHGVVKGAIDADVGCSRRWVIAKSWTQCPLGMLPCAVGYSGCLPVLDYNDTSEHDAEVLGGNDGKWELNSCTGKKRDRSDLQLLNKPSVKKMRETMADDCVLDEEDVSLSEDINAMSSKDVNGHLMIGGAWKKVGEEELLSITSAVRILV